MVIDGYELSKYIDPVTARIINFIYKAKILYTCSEDNNSKLLKYSYLNLCTYNREREERDYYKLLGVNFSDLNMSTETSNWSIEYNRYLESIKRKCDWCNIKCDFCPIKVFADMKNYAIHNKLEFGKLIEKLVEEPNIKTINNDVIEKNIANRILKMCDEYSSLMIAKLLIETKTMEITEFFIDGMINYKYIDLKVNSDSLINNLYNYYTGMGNILEGSFNSNTLEKKNSGSEKNKIAPHKISAFLLYLCRKEKINPSRVFEKIIDKLGNLVENKFNTYYNWYIYQVEKLDCTENVKNQVKEVLTYIKNYHTKYEYHLPYIQINLQIEIDDQYLLDKIVKIIYRFATNCEYIKEKISIVDAEFLFSKYEKDIDIIANIDKMYKDAGLIIIKNIEKILLSQSKTECFFREIESCIKEFSRTITIIVSKKETEDIVKGYPELQESIRHNIQVDDYTLEKIQSKILEKLKNNYEITEQTEENIKEYIENDYMNNISKNNDYIENLYKDILYGNFNIIDISYKLKDERIPYNKNKEEKAIKRNLEELIGLKEIKREVQKFRNLLVFNKKIENRLENRNMNMNMLFLGNPGTGKTTVARIMADILYELGYIKKNKFIDVTAKDLVSEYIGHTAIKTSKIIENALDGVLFIDEAYSIVSNNRNASFGEESIATLVQAMEKYRDRLVVIFAGYTLEMKNFIDTNPGIASRIGYTFEFSNYTTDELMQIFENHSREKGFEIEESAKGEIISIIENEKNARNFGNARFMINLFEKIVMVHAQEFNEENLLLLTKKDVLNLNNENYKVKQEITNIYGELNNLIALGNVKKEIEGLVDLVVMNNKLEKRIPLNLNMIFLGNPGTGKTTVARIFAEILYNLGYIKTNKLIEVTGKDLIGEYVGETSKKTAKVLENALDGLLFVDEAYTLMNQAGDKGNFSQDAISTITKYMTDYEGRLTIIFAGYKEEMKNFMEINSGLISRIGETINFEDYGEKELLEIYKRECNKANFTLDNGVDEAILELIKQNKQSKNFGNARFIINVFKKTLMKHAKRCRNINDLNELMKITAEDVPQMEMPKVKRIGF